MRPRERIDGTFFERALMGHDRRKLCAAIPSASNAKFLDYFAWSVPFVPMERGLVVVCGPRGTRTPARAPRALGLPPREPLARHAERRAPPVSPTEPRVDQVQEITSLCDGRRGLLRPPAQDHVVRSAVVFESACFFGLGHDDLKGHEGLEAHGKRDYHRQNRASEARARFEPDVRTFRLIERMARRAPGRDAPSA